MSTPPRTPTRRLPHGLGPLGLGLVRPEFAEPPPHAVAARLAERALGIGLIRKIVKEPRAVGVAVRVADGLDRVEVDGGGRRAAAVVGPLGVAAVSEERQVVGFREFWGSTGGRLGRWVADEGWRPPPPKLNLDEHDDESVSSLRSCAGKISSSNPDGA